MSTYSRLTGEMYGSAQAKRLAESREITADRQEDARLNAARAKELRMTTKRTKWGLVEKPPTVKEDDRVLDEWREQIDAALDTAQKITERERVLKTADAVDKNRFASLRGQS